MRQWSDLTELGYQIVDAKGEPYAGRSFLTYYIRTPNGEILDNFGTGYGQFTYAYDAAKQHAARSAQASREKV